MKTSQFSHVIAASALLAASLLVYGCGQSSSTESTDSTPPTAPQTSSSKPSEPAKVVSAPVQAPPATPDTSALDDLTKELTSSAQGKVDTVLADLSKDLSSKIQALKQSAGSGSPVQDTLNATVKAISDNQGIQSLDLVQQITQAKLTPEQTQLAAEVRNLVSAVTVQKNFSALTGAEGEVGKIVSALRSADTATALTHLKQIASNASLTDAQKNLLNKLVEQYAPGLQDAGKALQDGVKGLNPF